MLGTDAASEGLNLQRLGTLINIDLPWNPTRLEQRKGRIQRIGQARNEIWIANLRYRGSVEDRVHQVLADRLEAIHDLFGQIPDTLEDVWVQVAMNDEQAANQLIDRTTATRNPFDAKYSKVEDADWETCSSVLNGFSMKEMLSRGGNCRTREYKSLTRQQRRWLKRRQAVEPAIGHLKSDHRMDRCWLQGQLGDALHAVLCAAGYNLRWLLWDMLRLGLKAAFCAHLYWR